MTTIGVGHRQAPAFRPPLESLQKLFTRTTFGKQKPAPTNPPQLRVGRDGQPRQKLSKAVFCATLAVYRLNFGETGANQSWGGKNPR